MIIGGNNKSDCDLAVYLILLCFLILLVNVLMIRIWSPLTFLNLGFLYVILKTFIQLLWTLLFH